MDQVMNKVIAIFNQAGGVCKTTVAMNLGYHLALRNHHVLLIDVDPQASYTTFMGLEPHELAFRREVRRSTCTEVFS